MKPFSRPNDVLHPLQPFLERVRLWAATRPDIAAILLVGSWVRGEAGPESDVDLVIVTEEPGRMLNDHGWLDDLGTVHSVQEEDWGRVQSLRVVHAAELEVEYGLTDRVWLAEPMDPGTEAVLKGGVRIVFQRDDHISRALEPFLSDDVGAGGPVGPTPKGQATTRRRMAEREPW